MTATARIRRVTPDTETLVWGALAVTTEFLLIAGYLVGFDVTIRDWSLFVVPFVWINVSLWAILRTSVASVTTRKRAIAALLAAGYFLLLAYFGGLVGPNGTPVRGVRLAVSTLPPGWSPAVLYNGAAVSLVLLPYKVIGYLALAYLVYATALDASNALLGGIVGLFSCVSCSFPLVASLVTGIAGSGTGLMAATSGSSVALNLGVGVVTVGPFVLSTVVFVVTVALLYWRPTIGSLWFRPLASRGE